MRPLLRPKQIQILLRISQRIDRFTDWVGGLSTWLVLLTVGVGFYNVLARFIGRQIGLKLSSNALVELQWYLFALTFFTGFAYILRHGENVRVDFLYANWSDRTKALVDFWGTVLFLIPFCVLGLWTTFDPILTSWGFQPDGSWGNWEVSPDADGLPRAPIKTMILLAFGTLLLQAVAQTIKYMAVVNGYPNAAEALQGDIENLPLE
jgi:TRAP-type mannitol/chloroaromatic compound transport system permease small subunit